MNEGLSKETNTVKINYESPGWHSSDRISNEYELHINNFNVEILDPVITNDGSNPLNVQENPEILGVPSITSDGKMINIGLTEGVQINASNNSEINTAFSIEIEEKTLSSSEFEVEATSNELRINLLGNTQAYNDQKVKVIYNKNNDNYDTLINDDDGNPLGPFTFSLTLECKFRRS